MAVIALLGSGEFQPWAREVDTWCAEQASGSSDLALVIPTASAPEGEAVFARWAAMGVEHYRSLGLAADTLPLRTREDASNSEVVDAIGKARLLFLSGGNPGYLCETLEGTPAWEAVCAAVASGAALGGCSAGAVAIGTLAPYLINDEVDRWVPALRLLEQAYILPHFDQLDVYEPGLRDMALSLRPDGSVSVGIDENTALYGEDGDWRVTGALGVWIGEDELTPYRHGERVAQQLGLKLP